LPPSLPPLPPPAPPPPPPPPPVEAKVWGSLVDTTAESIAATSHTLYIRLLNGSVWDPLVVESSQLPHVALRQSIANAASPTPPPPQSPDAGGGGGGDAGAPPPPLSLWGDQWGADDGIFLKVQLLDSNLSAVRA